MDVKHHIRLDQRAEPGEAAWPYERRNETGNETIDASEIACPLTGAMADQQLMLEEQRLGREGTYPAGAEDLHEGDEQVNAEDESITRGAFATTVAGARQTSRLGKIA